MAITEATIKRLIADGATIMLDGRLTIWAVGRETEFPIPDSILPALSKDEEAFALYHAQHWQVLIESERGTGGMTLKDGDTCRGVLHEAMHAVSMLYRSRPLRAMAIQRKAHERGTAWASKRPNATAA